MDVLKYTATRIFRSDKLLAELDTLHRELFNSPIERACENCIDDALRKIKYELRKKGVTMEKQKCNFKLKEGIVQWIPGLRIHISNNNITDELALKVLKISKSTLKNFAEYPDNVMELIGIKDTDIEPPKSKEKEGEKETPEKKEPKEIPSVEQLVDGNTRASLVTMAENYPAQITFSATATKKDIATAIVNRMILDSDA